MTYQVGDRVWCKKGYFCYFLNFTNKGFCRIATELDNSKFGDDIRYQNDIIVSIDEISQTADDMFKELGYEKSDFTPRTILNYEKFDSKCNGR